MVLASAAGLALDLFAPGDEVMTAHVAGAGELQDNMVLHSGTSFAAPLVCWYRMCYWFYVRRHGSCNRYNEKSDRRHWN